MRTSRVLRWIAALSGVALLGAGVPAAAESITGEVVDLACYIPHPATGRGRGHRKCAEACLKKGMPAGILTEDKQLFLLLEDHDNPKPYESLKSRAAETVTVEGTKVSEAGLQGFVVRDVR